jgi:hypothetical protein
MIRERQSVRSPWSSGRWASLGRWERLLTDVDSCAETPSLRLPVGVKLVAALAISLGLWALIIAVFVHLVR